MKTWRHIGMSILSVVSVLPTFSGVQAQSGQSASRLTMQGPAEQSETPTIKDALGRPCLDVEAVARAQAINRDMFDHVVSIKNNCPKVIKVKLCYFQRTQCNEFSVSGYSRVDSILGTMLKVSTFRYSIKQTQY